MATNGTRPHGVPKAKPKCPHCKAILVEDDAVTPNSRMSIQVDEVGIDEELGIPTGFIYYWCMGCNKELPFFIGERVSRYWVNGGLRQKPGRKPKSNEPDAESAA